MSSKKNDRVKLVLDFQKDNLNIDEIALKMEFKTTQALKSFMSRNGYKINKGTFVLKDEEKEPENKKTINKLENNKSNSKKDTKATKDSRVDTVLDLQIYNVPLFKISKMIDMTELEIDKMMEEHGYIRTGEKFVTKPKVTKLKPEKKKKSTAKKKEKTQKELLEEEYKKNPAKRGTYDPISQVWVINVQLVEIIDLQLEGKTIGQIAKHVKMTKPALIEFMEEKGYVLENNKFIQYKNSKNIAKQKDDETAKEEKIVIQPKPKVYDNRKENVEFTEQTFKDIQDDLEEMFNWYKNIKDHHLFESLKKI